MMKIVIDAMGGDFGPEPIIEGVIEALNEEDFIPVLVGSKDEILLYLPEYYIDKVEFYESSDVIEMSDIATNVLRRKDSSIYKSIEYVIDNKADAIVSAGHSGATMALSTLRLKRISNVLRPGLATLMPNIINDSKTLLLDVGAVTDCSAENLYQFAIMGYIYANKILGLENPKIGLLSNGEENSKGNQLTKEAFKLMSKLSYFKGNVEGNDIFTGDINVVICDGYSGNIVLKTAEGVVSTIFTLMKKQIKKSIPAKIGALLMKKKVFKSLKKEIDYAEYGGAPLLGINGYIIIAHGKSNSKAIKNAIFQAILFSKSQINIHIEEIMSKKVF